MYVFIFKGRKRIYYFSKKQLIICKISSDRPKLALKYLIKKHFIDKVQKIPIKNTFRI